MTPNIIKNYANNLTRIRNKNSAYNFISYDNFDPKTTFHPDLIQDCFPDVKFQKLRYPSLTEAYDNYYYFGRPSQI